MRMSSFTSSRFSRSDPEVFGLFLQLSFDVQDKESDLYLTANLSMLSASDPERITCDLLEFLHDSNCRLTVFPVHLLEVYLSIEMGSLSSTF